MSCFHFFIFSFGQRTLQKAFIDQGETSTGFSGDISGFSNGDPLIVVGKRSDISGNFMDGFRLYRLNSNLEVLDEAFFRPQDKYYLGYLSVQVLHDTVYVAGYTYFNTSNPDIFFASFDKDLNLIQSKILEAPLNSSRFNIYVHPDGGLGGTGYMYGQDQWHFGMRFHGNGTISWIRKSTYAGGLRISGAVLSNGDVLVSGGDQIWSIDKDGELNWVRSYPGFNFNLLDQAEQEQQIFCMRQSFGIKVQNGFRMDISGNYVGMMEGFIDGESSFVMSLPSKRVLVGCSRFGGDSSYLRITEYATDGKIIRHSLIYNYLGYSKNPSMYNTSPYSTYVSTTGIPYIFGVSDRRGFTLIRLSKGGDYSCATKSFETVQGPEPQSKNVNISLIDLPAKFETFGFFPENRAEMKDTILCNQCIDISYRLPNDTVLCPGEILEVQIGFDVESVEWNDGQTGRTRRFDKEGDFVCRLSNECETLYDTLRISYKKVPHLKILGPEEGYPEVPVTFNVHEDSYEKVAWYFNDSLFGTSTSATLSFGINGIYWVSASALQDGCLQNDSVSIKIMLHDWYFPSAFTPDANNLNDFWGPQGTGILEYSLKIYTSWGELIFDEENKSWDGNFKGEKCTSGQYAYMARIFDDQGKFHYFRGVVTLLK